MKDRYSGNSWAQCLDNTGDPTFPWAATTRPNAVEATKAAAARTNGRLTVELGRSAASVMMTPVVRLSRLVDSYFRQVAVSAVCRNVCVVVTAPYSRTAQCRRITPAKMMVRSSAR
jgi:hypothetical protein